MNKRQPVLVALSILFFVAMSLVSKVSLANNPSITETYLRCFYRDNASNLTPATSYVWGVDPNTHEDYQIKGYWWQPGLLAIENLFYTKTSQETLLSICQDTLTNQGISAPVAMYAGADSDLSINYTVWTLDSSAPGDKINRIVAFGDSLSDTQNMFNATDWKLPNKSNYFAGRFSNGKNWLDYMSERFNMPVYNWAVGGAAADNYYVVPGVGAQVSSLISRMQLDPGYQVSNTLFTMLIGGNDLANYGRSVESIIQAELDALTTLITFGGKNILLVNLPDVSRAPLFALRTNGPFVSEQVKYYNQKLSQIADYLRKTYGSRVNIQLFDAYGLFDRAMQDPGKYGFTNTTQSCLDINSDHITNYLFHFSPRANCADADTFVFWDLLHPTTHSHKMLAYSIGGFVQEKFK